MLLRTLAQFLVGKRQAIRDLAGQRRLIWLAFVLTLTAGLARTYDREDLVAEPWHLLIPATVSAALALVILALISWLGWRRWRMEQRPDRSTMPVVIALIWCMSPMAWLYAIPWERWLDSGQAMRLNLYVLTLVSVWRVCLLTRVFTTLFAMRTRDALFIVLGVANALMFTALAVLPFPIIAFMGGFDFQPWESVLGTAAFVWQGITLLALFPLAIGLIGVCVAGGRAWRWDRPTDQQAAGRKAWAATVAVLAVFLICLPQTQPAQHLRHRIDRLWDDGNYQESIRLLASVRREDLPPFWNLPMERPRHQVLTNEEFLALAWQVAPDSWLIERGLPKVILWDGTMSAAEIAFVLDICECRPDLVDLRATQLEYLRKQKVLETDTDLAVRLEAVLSGGSQRAAEPSTPVP